VFYDPRIAAKDYFVLEVKRTEVKDEVTEYLAYEQTLIKEVNDIVNQLTF